MNELIRTTCYARAGFSGSLQLNCSHRFPPTHDPYGASELRIHLWSPKRRCRCKEGFCATAQHSHRWRCVKPAIWRDLIRSSYPRCADFLSLPLIRQYRFAPGAEFSGLKLMGSAALCMIRVQGHDSPWHSEIRGIPFPKYLQLPSQSPRGSWKREGWCL